MLDNKFSKGDIVPFSNSEERNALRMETTVISDSPVELSSAEEGVEDMEEIENNNSQEVDSQEPQSTGGELSSPRATPMEIKEEGGDPTTEMSWIISGYWDHSIYDNYPPYNTATEGKKADDVFGGQISYKCIYGRINSYECCGYDSEYFGRLTGNETGGFTKSSAEDCEKVQRRR